MQIAPLCFPLARRKNLSVKEALSNDRWLCGLQRITTEAQLDQFINLWQLLQQVPPGAAVTGAPPIGL
jgi:hypothetical protein